MKILQGDTKPKAEQKHLYQLNTIIPAYTSNVFSPTKIDAKYTWTLYRFVNNQWQQVKKNIKYGEKNEYLFGQGVVGIPFKIMIHSEEKNILQITENKLVAELTVIPRTAKEPVIGRVILLNKNNSDVNKAKFNESLTAQARTSNLLGKDITFYLWEEGTSEFEKYKKPKKGTVNKHGIAEVKFNLSEYASPQTWMSFFQPNSNATKKFYVSAVYEDKKATNKTPVTATNGQPQTPRTQQPSNPPPTNNQPQNQNQGSGILSATRDIIAEGLGSIFNAVENTVSPAQVNSQPEQKKKENTEKGECFCNRDITPEELMNLGISKKNTDKFLESINSTMVEYSINTCERKLHFLAQLRHESGEFVYQEEIASGSAYEGRKDLGNTQTGDGRRFKGRGLIQITGRSNYTKYGNYKRIDFTKEPDNQKLEQLPYCTDSAGWYWSKCLSEDLNDFADKDDVIYITYRINGGFNGYVSDRKPKLVRMIKSIKCKNVTFENYDIYSIKKSNAWNKHDAVYKYARLNTSETKESYKRFLELTDDYLTWSSIKKSKKRRINMENKRKIAYEKSK